MSSDNNNTRESIEEETENDDDQIRQQQQQQKKKKKKEKEKEARIEFEKRLKGAKNLVMLPLRKLQRAYTRRKRRPPPAPFPYSEDLGGGGGGGSGGSLGCHHLCFVQPRVSDPPHPDDDLPPLRTNPDAKASSYHDFLRSLLERNDFYSPECNVHREI